MSDDFSTRGLLYLPKPSEVSYETMSGEKRIRWDVVEPWLYRLKEAGAIAVLAKAFDIGQSTLEQRRKEMNLPPLPVGRPRKVDLTEYERQVLLELRAGKTQAQIARQRGVNPATVNGTVRAIAAKQALASRACAYCGGAGVRPCGSDGEPLCANGVDGVMVPIAPHHHVCIHCGGTSSYTANPTPPCDFCGHGCQGKH